MGEQNIFDLDQIEKKIQQLLSDFEAERSIKEQLQRKNQELKNQVTHLEEQLSKAAYSEEQLAKEDLADILLEAKKTANKMINKAEKEAEHLLEEKKSELKIIVAHSHDLVSKLDSVQKEMNTQFDAFKLRLENLSKGLYEKQV